MPVSVDLRADLHCPGFNQREVLVARVFYQNIIFLIGRSYCSESRYDTASGRTPSAEISPLFIL